MDQSSSTEMWLWRFYRAVAHFVHQSDATNEAELLALIARYREESRASATARRRDDDEHEWGFHYR